MKRLVGAAIGLAMVLAACSGGGSQSSFTPTSVSPQSNVRASCGVEPPLGYAHCLNIVRIDIGGGGSSGFHGRFTASPALASPDLVFGSPSGLGAQDLQSAYALGTVSATNGRGMTVAVVDGGDDINAESDLGVYRSQYHLPACTTANGCFKKVGESGTSSLPPPDAAWSTETSLDLDMVSAICPNCHILLVEVTGVAGTLQTTDEEAGENTAARLGANVISNSFGGGESVASDPAFVHPGIVITASSGDSGYSGGVEQPASLPGVVAVGGTTLTKASNARGWTEAAWSGAGSGCSALVAKPSWQTDACSKRNVADVSAEADPNTGVAVYDSVPFEGGVGWQVVGGTSASSPMIAAVFALAGNAASQNAASGLYANATLLNDVVGGNSGTCSPPYECNGVVGYDGPTGLGTPNGIGAF